MEPAGSEKELFMKKKIAVIPLEAITKKLNEKQKLFCELYVFSKEHFCSGVWSYLDAYGLKNTPKNYNSAKSMGYRLLTNVHIKDYISELLSKSFNNKFMDNELSRVAIQNKNLLAKMDAVKEYNKLKQRITERVELTIPVPIYGGKSAQKV